MNTKKTSLGSARFMKTIKCKHPEGPVVVKIFIKPEANLSLRKYVKGLQGPHKHLFTAPTFLHALLMPPIAFTKVERNALAEVPNAFPYQRVFETDKAGYMVRQYFANNLYDRIRYCVLPLRVVGMYMVAYMADAFSTRPFLNQIEKKWIAYQILAGLAEAHAHKVCLAV